jgi:hypothetical protein
MTRSTFTAAFVSAAGVSLMAAALAYGPAGRAAPGTDDTPPCLTEGTCALLTPATPRYLPLEPTPAARYLPLTPTTAAD